MRSMSTAELVASEMHLSYCAIQSNFRECIGLLQLYCTNRLTQIRVTELDTDSAAAGAADGLHDLRRQAEANIFRHYFNFFDAIESRFVANN